MSDRLARLGAPILLILALAGASLLRTDLALADPESEAAAGLESVLDALPAGSTVLVGFDPDLGTYAEVRPTVRTLLADLWARGATAALVSLTPEGRALAVAEMERLERLGAGESDVVDLGFVPGAEAALVRVADAIGSPESVEGPLGSMDLDGPSLILVVGGNDVGPRSWVEQVAPRIDPLPMVAVTPTVLLPEVEPYRESGQLAALVGTPRDGAAYRRDAQLGEEAELGDADGGPSALALLVGLLAAIAWLAIGLGRRIGPGLAARPERSRQ